MDKLDAVLASLAVACQLLIGAAFLIGSQSDPSSSAAVPTLQAVNRTLEEIQADYVENRHTDLATSVGVARAMLFGLQDRNRSLEAEKRTDAVLSVVSMVLLAIVVCRLHAKTRNERGQGRQARVS